jgi:hypothetical protein
MQLGQISKNCEVGEKVFQLFMKRKKKDTVAYL